MNGGNVIKANVSWFQIYVRYAILQNYFYFSEVFGTNTYNFKIVDRINKRVQFLRSKSFFYRISM